MSRDRAEAYAEGIRQGAPAAVQVADRWHLLQNLVQAIYAIFQQHHRTIEDHLQRAQVTPRTNDTGVAAHVASALSTPAPSPAERRRQRRVETAQQLYQQGWTQRAIAAQLTLCSKTVRRYLQTSLPLTRQRGARRRILEPFQPYLIARWNSGCHNAAQLWREIAQQGFAGQLTTVRTFTSGLRQASGLPPRTRSGVGNDLAAQAVRRRPTLRTLAWLILRPASDLNETEKASVAQVCAASSPLAVTVRLATEFAGMVRQRRVDQLDSWLEQAIQSGIGKLAIFAHGLRRDAAAVRAALSLPWSNGPVEGHINRLKCVKRQMYGRAKLDLLRCRLLAA